MKEQEEILQRTVQPIQWSWWQPWESHWQYCWRCWNIVMSLFQRERQMFVRWEYETGRCRVLVSHLQNNNMIKQKKKSFFIDSPLSSKSFGDCLGPVSSVVKLSSSVMILNDIIESRINHVQQQLPPAELREIFTDCLVMMVNDENIFLLFKPCSKKAPELYNILPMISMKTN